MYHKDLPMWLWRAMQQRTDKQNILYLSADDIGVIAALSGRPAASFQLANLIKADGHTSLLHALEAIQRAQGKEV